MMLRSTLTSQRLSRQRCNVLVRLFSDHKRQNAARLRAIRKGTAVEENVNYRYRKDGKNRSKEDLWGEEALEAERERKKKSLGFFDEVDAVAAADDKMDHKASIASFFEALGDPPPAKARSPIPPLKPPTSRASTSPPPSPSPGAKAPSSLGGRSIFDAFPIPEAPPPDNPNAYDEEAFQQYLAMLDEIITAPKFLREHSKKPIEPEFMKPIRAWLAADEKKVEYSLPLLQTSVEQGLASQLSSGESSDQAVAFRAELDKQRQAFLSSTGLSQKQYEQASLALKLMGSMCAKRARSLPLDVAWEKIKEAGIIFDETALNNYLYACTVYAGGSRRKVGLFSTSGDSVFDLLSSSTLTFQETSLSEEKEDEEDYVVDVPEEVATFHDLLHEPTEQSVSIRIRALVAKGDAKGAEALLDRFSPKENEARLRTYVPILRCYLEQGDMSSGLKLFKEMRDNPTVLLESETYVQLISAIAEKGFFSDDSDPIEGAEKLGYSPPCGPGLFDKLASHMSEDVLEITSASARRLYSAFENAYRGQDVAKNLTAMHPLAPLSTDNGPAADNELIVSRVLVAADTGVCPRSGATLRLINLGPDERKQTINNLFELSETQFEAFNRHDHSKRNNHAPKSLSEFANWLDTRKGEPFTAVVDGANVAYYMQNFDQGKFNVYQIQFIIDALEKMKENPLVVIPQKYGSRSFSTSGSRRKQHLNQEELDIFKRLSAEGRIYFVPAGCLDDYYWMLASVSDQKVSRGGKTMEVTHDDESGRWPGARPMLITNDQMRDHKLELLAPRLFRRWYSCYIVNYNFTAFVDNECVDREISFSTADFFSREIQGNPTRKSDGTDGGMAWHFPVSDWEVHERFCLRLPESR